MEDAASGKDLERPGHDYALTCSATGQASGIVVSRLDRLSRSVHDFATLLKRAQGPRAGTSTVPDEVIARVTALLAEGATLAQVANQLTQDHVPLPSGKAGIWQATQVRRLLRSAASAN